MRMLKKVVFYSLALIVLFLLVGFILPQKPHVERSVSINASAADIYPYIAQPKVFHGWSPWTNIDPEMETIFSGPESGVGAAMKWSSEHPNVGSGSSIITKAVENKSIETALDFGDQGSATSFMRLQANYGATRITWGFDMDAGMNPIARWFGLLMDSMVGADYEKGLQELKRQVESED